VTTIRPMDVMRKYATHSLEVFHTEASGSFTVTLCWTVLPLRQRSITGVAPACLSLSFSTRGTADGLGLSPMKTCLGNMICTPIAVGAEFEARAAIGELDSGPYWAELATSLTCSFFAGMLPPLVRDLEACEIKSHRCGEIALGASTTTESHLPLGSVKPLFV
jgi:hypothetical protein